MRQLLNLLKIAVGAYVGLGLFMYFFLRSFLYMPRTANTGSQTPSFELPVPGAKLRIAVCKRESDEALLYFGGNAEVVADSLPDFSEQFPNHAIYLMNYRGYCGSTGKPKEVDLHADALALYEYVRVKHTRITVLGRSLGSGVAIRLGPAHQ